MASPYNNDHPNCQHPTACKRHGIAAGLCQPCHFRNRRIESKPMTTAEEEKAVRLLGERIGYGRAMTLCEKLWNESLGDLRGGAFSVGPCVVTLVVCPHPDKTEHCDWCCGSGRVTKRVLAAMTTRS